MQKVEHYYLFFDKERFKTDNTGQDEIVCYQFITELSTKVSS